MPAAHVTLFAQWTTLPTYTVIYNPGTQGTFQAQVTSGLLAGAATPTAPTITGNTGYDFVGWSPTWSATVVGNVTYTAQLSLTTEPTTYTVSYAPGTQGTFATQTSSGLTFGRPLLHLQRLPGTPTTPLSNGVPQWLPR